MDYLICSPFLCYNIDSQLFNIQGELITATNSKEHYDYILMAGGMPKIEERFIKLLKDKKISQLQYDDFERKMLREIKPDVVIEL